MTVDAPTDLEAALDRLLPTALEEAAVGKVEDDFVVFLGGLTKLEHERVLGLLPGRPIFEALPETPEATELGTTSPRQRLKDILCYHAVLYYVRHVPPYEIIAHLLERLKVKPGKALRRLVGMLSGPSRYGLFEELLQLDLQGEDAYDIVAEFEETLRSEFELVRPGYIDVALARFIAELEKNPADVKDKLELHLLRKIRAKRRADPARLPKISRVAETRFIAEEAHRELFVYPDPDHKKAVELMLQVYDWYYSSKARHATLGKPIFGEIWSFFDELHGTARALNAGWAWEARWKYYVEPWLGYERFWHNLAGLNQDIPYKYTEAASREAAYKRAAALAGLAYAAAILAPIVLMVAIRAPGAVVRLVVWSGSRLLLATQYAYTTIRVFGFLGGTARMMREGYVFYLQNAPSINQHVANGVEIVLDIFGYESGMAPGSSAADLAGDAALQVEKLAKKGIAAFASDAKKAAQKADTEIELVEFIAESTVDRKTYRITAEITGAEKGNPKAVIRNFEEVVSGYGDAKKVTFFSKAEDLEAAAQQARGLPPPPALPPSSLHAFQPELSATPSMTLIHGQKVKSWHPDALVGTSRSQMKSASLKIIKGKADHPLQKALVNGRFKDGGTKVDWAKDARFMEAGHVKSGKQGGPDIIVLMSANHNRRLGGDLETAGTTNAFIADEVFVIDGIAVHKQTARDLVDQGWLDASALDNAKTIDLRKLDFEAPPVTGVDAAARATANKMKREAMRTAPPSPVKGGLRAKPERTTIAGRKMDSWHPTALVGTSQDQMRNQSMAIINSTPNHPLSRTLVDGRFLDGGTKEIWKNDARYMEAAHVVSSNAGGARVVVLMSANYNQKFGRDIERTGAIALDEVLDIGGIAMHKLTAQDLVKQGWLDKSVVDNAPKIDLQHLEP